MPEYRYTVKSADGSKMRGIMEAPDEIELYNRLRTEDKFLLNSTIVGASENIGKLKVKQLSNFSRQLGTLLHSGVSLVRALSIISQEESLKPQEKSVYEGVLRLIRQGVSLSEAMGQQGRAFPELMINMYRSAETAGSMDKTAMRMAEHYEKDYRLNKKVKNAMMYPMILGILTVAVVIFIFTFVMPQFQSLFDTMDELPLPTRIVLAITDTFTNHWFTLLLVSFILVIAIIFIFRIPRMLLWKDKIKLRIPVIGRLLKIIYTARFTRTLSSLYSSGLPIVTALQIGRNTIGNSYIASQFDDAIMKVRGGGTLSEALGGIDGFVNKLHSTIMIGEETGSLDSMLDSISDSLDYDSEMAISSLVTLLEPVMIIIMAVIVGFIMISVLMPIFNSYGAIEQSGNVY